MQTLAKLTTSILLLSALCFGQRSVFFAQNSTVSSSNTFTFLNKAHASDASCGSGTTCNITVPSTTSGSTRVVWVRYEFTGTISVTSVKMHTSGTSFTVPASCTAFDTDGEGIAGFYLIGGSSGETQVDIVMASGPFQWGAKYQEFSATSTPTFEGCKTGTLIGSTITCSGSNTCTGPTESLTGTNDAITQLITVGHDDVTSFVAPYATNQDVDSGLGASIVVNSTSQPATVNTTAATEPGAAAGVMAWK